MKKIQLFLLAVLCGSMLSAQTLEQGKALLKEEQYLAAKQIFNALNKQKPSAEACYLLGQSYFSLGQIDSAEIAFQQGLKIKPKYAYNTCGLGKIQLEKGNTAAAWATFKNAKKVGGRDLNLILSIVDAALTVSKKDTALARTYLEIVREKNPKYPDLYVLSGDYYVQIRDLGKAINDYNTASYYGADKYLIYNKLAGIYVRTRSFKDAEANYQSAIEANPNGVVVYKKLGDLYYTYGKYTEAKTAYSTYFSKANPTVDEKEKFALILFFKKDYNETEKLINEIAAQNKDNAVLYRVRAYAAYERGDYQNGLEFMNQFFATQKPERVIALDYEYNGKLLSQTGKDSMAIVNLLKAFELDTNKYQNIEDVAKIYSKGKNYDMSVKYYSLLKKNPQQDKVSLPFIIGKEYYFKGMELKSLADTLAKKNPLSRDISSLRAQSMDKFNHADSCFSVVISLSPKAAAGYLWKGRMQSLIDPVATTDNAKKAYESLLTILQASENPDKKLIIECYKNFASYNFLQIDKEKNPDNKSMFKKTTIDYFEKVLSIDPTDKQSIEALKSLKPETDKSKPGKK